MRQLQTAFLLDHKEVIFQGAGLRQEGPQEADQQEEVDSAAEVDSCNNIHIRIDRPQSFSRNLTAKRDWLYSDADSCV